MSISRRHFILGAAGAAAGLILPSYYRRALEYIDRTGKPLLETVDRPSRELFAVKGRLNNLEYSLALGDPYAGPPSMTLRQFADHYDIDLIADWYMDEDEIEDWDAEVNWGEDCFYDTWMYRDAPEMLAYELLKPLDLGPKLIGPEAVGDLMLEAGSSMVSSYWNVEAADEITLSLLQDRLNALGTGVKIVMA